MLAKTNNPMDIGVMRIGSHEAFPDGYPTLAIAPIVMAAALIKVPPLAKPVYEERSILIWPPVLLLKVVPLLSP